MSVPVKTRLRKQYFFDTFNSPKPELLNELIIQWNLQGQPHPDDMDLGWMTEEQLLEITHHPREVRRIKRQQKAIRKQEKIRAQLEERMRRDEEILERELRIEVRRNPETEIPHQLLKKRREELLNAIQEANDMIEKIERGMKMSMRMKRLLRSVRVRDTTPNT